HYWTAADETRGRERALDIGHRRRALDHVRAGCTQEPGRLLNEPLGKPGPTPRPQEIDDPAPELAAAHVRAQDEGSTDGPAVAEQEPPIPALRKVDAHEVELRARTIHERTKFISPSLPDADGRLGKARHL